MIAWQTVPAIRLFPHVIYMEWVVCATVFLLVYLLDSAPIKVVTLDKLTATFEE